MLEKLFSFLEYRCPSAFSTSFPLRVHCPAGPSRPARFHGALRESGVSGRAVLSTSSCGSRRRDVQRNQLILPKVFGHCCLCSGVYASVHPSTKPPVESAGRTENTASRADRHLVIYRAILSSELAHRSARCLRSALRTGRQSGPRPAGQTPGAVPDSDLNASTLTRLGAAVSLPAEPPTAGLWLHRNLHGLCSLLESLVRFFPDQTASVCSICRRPAVRLQQRSLSCSRC